MPKSKKRPGGHDKLWWRMNFNEFSSMRNGWKKEKELAVKALRSGNLTESETKDLRNYKKYADYQQREAAKLFRKLDNYAARHSVPMKWRIY